MGCGTDCSIDWIDGDAEPIEPSTIKMVRGRKEHKCDECGETIPSGSLQEHVKGLVDGGAFSHRTCVRCLGVRTDCFKGGWVYGTLRDDFLDCQGFDYVHEPEKLWQLQQEEENHDV